MNTLHRRRLLQTALLLAAPLHGRPARACEYFAPTLRITHPWTRATPADAPFAMLGLRFDEVTEDDQLIAVETPVANAVVFVPAGAGAAEQPLPLHIPAGRDTVLGSASPGPASAHLRLLRLNHSLEAARSYPLRLVFQNGGSVKTLLNVDYARFA